MLDVCFFFSYTTHIYDRPKGAFFRPNTMGRFITYIRDTRAEMRHVSWPTQRQTLVFTAVVIVVSLLTAAYLGFFDWLFTTLLQYII